MLIDYERGADAGIKFQRKVERIRELLDAKDEWRRENRQAEIDRGVKAAQNKHAEMARQILGMEDAFGQIPVRTLQGLMFKAVVAARYIGTLEELASYPDDRNPLGAVVRDLVVRRCWTWPRPSLDATLPLPRIAAYGLPPR
ncbi:hypothetical protein WDZ92_42230 [Nostoc sp. NIES-2111]